MMQGGKSGGKGHRTGYVPTPFTQARWQGDWTCPSCDNHVFGSKSVCGRCGHQKQDPHQTTPAQQHAHQDAAYARQAHMVSSGLQAPNPRLTRDWTCTSCGYLVHARKTLCPKCGADPVQNDSNSSRYAVQPVREAGEWSCPSCAAQVFACRATCYKCGTQRPGVNMDPETAKVVQIADLASLDGPKARVLLHRAGGDVQTALTMLYDQPGLRDQLGSAVQPHNSPQAPHPPAGGVTRAGDWNCRCGVMNFASRRQCFKCQAPRTSAANTAAPPPQPKNENTDCDTEEASCPVCLEEFTQTGNSAPIILAPCGHCICKGCSQSFGKERPRDSGGMCPVCRTVIESKVAKVYR